MRDGEIRDGEIKEEVELREGATISGVMHGIILALMLFGTDFLSARESAPLNVTEVTLVNGSELDAAASSAPSVVEEVPDELQPEEDKDQALLDLSVPDVSIQVPDTPVLAPEDQPDDSTPDFAAILVPPPPTSIVTAPPRPSIAEIPSPDEVLRQAPTPESPPSPSPVRALAEAPRPEAAPRAPAPPEPEPEATPTPEPDPEVAEEPEPEPEPEEDKPVEAEAPDDPPAEDPAELAPPGPAPQVAKLPVAKPADLAAAALAARAEEKSVTPEKPPEEEEPKPEETAAPKPTPAAPASPSQFAGVITPGEKDALRLGIKEHFVYNGNTSDLSLFVTIQIRLAEDGTIIGKPEQIDAGGGDKAIQAVLFRDGRRALLKAQGAGEFKKLPPEKYSGWKLIHVTFTPEEIGFSS